MKTASLLLAAVLIAATSDAAVVAPPDGKDNALAAPVAPQSTATQVPPPKGSQSAGTPSVDPAEPLPTDPTAPDPAPYVPEKREFNNDPMIRVDVLMVSLPEEVALPLLLLLRDPAQFATAEKKLLDLIAKKTATLEGWPEVTTHSGIRAVSESIVEQRYPVEFSLPGSRKGGDKPDPAAKEPSPAERAVAHLQMAGMVVPETFETRNVGVTLEVEPVISPDGTAISLQIAPAMVRLERFMDFPAGTTAKGDKVSIQQPIFTTSKVNTSLTLRDGERRLVHIGRTSELKTRVDLFIIGASVVPAPK